MLRQCLLTLALLLCIVPAAAGDAVAPSLSAPEAASRAATGDLLLIDVRHPSEWRQTGIPSAAETASIHHPGGLPAFLRRVEQLSQADRAQPIALICASGVRSAFAADLLRRNGYSQVFNLTEGMRGSAAGAGWLRRGLPTRPCREC